MIQYDTHTEVADTTWLDRVSGRSYVMTSDRGYRSMGLLYGPTRALVVSPDGDGFWKADGYGHTFARLSADTDTTMMVKRTWSRFRSLTRTKPDLSTLQEQRMRK